MGIQEDFEAYHQRNPHVYDLFVRFTRDLMRRGWARGSAKLIIERMRWEYMIETVSDDFKISNNYTSRYARLAMAQEPDLAGFFETKRLHEDCGPDEAEAPQVEGDDPVSVTIEYVGPPVPEAKGQLSWL